MRAVVLRGKGTTSVAVEEIPVPVPNPNQLLVRVDAAGICTSLIKCIDQGSDHPFLYGWDIALHPAILGDEGSVTVVLAGQSTAEKYPIGSRYVVQPAVDHSPINNRKLYANGGIGISKVACGYTLPGMLAEYQLVSEEILLAQCLVPLPTNDIPYAHAAIAEPMSCCVSGLQRHIHLHQDSLTEPRTPIVGIKKGGMTAIVGLGAMGRMNLEFALAGGAAVIIGSDPIKSRRAKAVDLFSQRAKENNCKFIAVHPRQFSELAMQVSGGVGFDDIIVAVGSAAVIEASLQLLAKGGSISLFGGLQKGQEKVVIDANSIHYKETRITGTSGGTAWDIAETLRLMASGRIVVDRHIVKVGSMNHALQLIDDVRHQRLDGKAVLYPHRPIDQAFEVNSWSAEDEAEHLK